jgi:hypothetical protein
MKNKYTERVYEYVCMYIYIYIYIYISTTSVRASVKLRVSTVVNDSGLVYIQTLFVLRMKVLKINVNFAVTCMLFRLENPFLSPSFLIRGPG